MEFIEDVQELIDQYSMSSMNIERIIFTHRYQLTLKDSSLLTVQSIPILYSYWEGFIHQIFGLYIEYINSLQIDFKELNENIKITYMEMKYKQLRQYPNASDKKIKFYHLLEEHFETNKHAIKPYINTEGNVNFEVLNKLLNKFGITPFNEQWNVYRNPNPNLKDTLKDFLKYRNQIAHGGDIYSGIVVTQAIYSRFRILVNKLMYELLNKFSEAIEQKSYLKR